MAIQGIEELIERLIQGTRSGKLRWESTANEYLFRLTLDSGMIHSYQILPSTLDISDSAGRPPLGFGISLLNENNVSVESVSSRDMPNLRAQLEVLYNTARNSALKPSELLQQLRTEIIRRTG